jgi:hypothetical protein
MPPVEWTMLYLFVALKIPVVAAIWLVWWAIKQEPDPSEDVRDDGGGYKRPHPAPQLPRAPRRGPHGEPALPSPPRIRPVVDARSRERVG